MSCHLKNISNVIAILLISVGLKVLNKAHAGSSNDGIVRRVLPNILRLLTQYKPEELFVIIGWSSPERKDFFTEVDHEVGEPEDHIGKVAVWETLYPAELHQKQLKIYVYIIFAKFHIVWK